MQIKTIADQLNTTVKEAQKIYDSVLDSFPDLAQFIEESQQMAREHGWVSTVWGRRRQLPNMQLPLYEFEYANGVNPDFDPLLDDEEFASEVPIELVEEYTTKLINCWGYKQKQQILESLEQQGIIVTDNTGKVTDSERQCVNCVDFETEILTTSGWKKYNEVKVGDTLEVYEQVEVKR